MALKILMYFVKFKKRKTMKCLIKEKKIKWRHDTCVSLFPHLNHNLNAHVRIRNKNSSSLYSTGVL